MEPALAYRREDDVKQVAQMFNARPRDQIERALADRISLQGVNSSSSSGQACESPDVRLRFQEDFATSLKELLEKRRFQWNSYESRLEKYFQRCLMDSKHLLGDDVYVLSRPLEDHTRELFSLGHKHREAISRIELSLKDLRQFLQLPGRFCAVRSRTVADMESALSLQRLRSAVVMGILAGFFDVAFGSERGNCVLLRWPNVWLEFLLILTPRDAESVLARLSDATFENRMRSRLLPLLDAVYALHGRRAENAAPVWVWVLGGGYEADVQRLDLNLQVRGLERPLRLSVLLEEVASAQDMIGAGDRDIVVVPSRTLQQHHVSGGTQPRVVVLSPNGQRSILAKQILDNLARLIPQYSIETTDASLVRNPARNFPLRDVTKMKRYYFVPRQSVSQKLQGFSNGARLWCSVRRSGKTTACDDLGIRLRDSRLAYQTCMKSEDENKLSFYDRITEAVAQGKEIPHTFLRSVVARCANGAGRVILVVDEYERLFDKLQEHAARSEERFRVVRQVVDQLYEFSLTNLLVFMGQRSDAHNIVMTYNHLAHAVEQEPFPLFTHGSEAEEFQEFVVKKVLASNETGLTCTEEFLNALFQETAGHPYLTVNVLTHFVDWLMEKRKVATNTVMQHGAFLEFVNSRLAVNRILRPGQNGRGYYDGFFEGRATNALSPQMGVADPWLYTVYWILRLISQQNSDAFCVDWQGFEGLMSKIPSLPETELPGPRTVLSTAAKANFLSYDPERETVSVKIRTLGRIAAGVEPRLS